MGAMQSIRRWVGSLARLVQVPDTPPAVPEPVYAPPVDPGVDDVPIPSQTATCGMCGRWPAFIVLEPCCHTACARCCNMHFAEKSLEHECPFCHTRLTRIARAANTGS